MRFRFFTTIFLVLSLIAFVVVILSSYLTDRWRRELVDQQVRETASSLINSELGEVNKVDFKKVEEIISEELGESRIGKFFVIRNDSGEILYESVSAQLLPYTEIPQDPQWVTLLDGERFIRVLNLRLPRISGQTLQVGLVTDIRLVSPGYFSEINATLLVWIMGVGLVAAWALTSFLLRPVDRLAQFLAQEELKLKSLPEISTIHLSNLGLAPRMILNYFNDEFTSLVKVLNSLIEGINRTNKIHRVWAAQLAHELKTPIAILRVQNEELKNEKVERELSVMSHLINSFLGWAELERGRQHRPIHALKACPVIESIAERFNETFGNRVQIKCNEEFTVFSDPQHFEQVVQNLISNALKYSEGLVQVEIKDKQLVVADHGPGLPDEVLSRLGDPFNKGSWIDKSSDGHGLGLAWVSTISKSYQWSFSLDSSPQGTRAELIFS